MGLIANIIVRTRRAGLRTLHSCSAELIWYTAPLMQITDTMLPATLWEERAGQIGLKRSGTRSQMDVKGFQTNPIAAR